MLWQLLVLSICLVSLWPLTHVNILKSCQFVVHLPTLFYCIYYLICCIHHPCLYMLACALLKTCKQIKTPVWGHTEIPRGECPRHENWVKEKMKRFRCIHSIWGSSEDAGRCADKCLWFWYACTMVFPLEDQSRQSWHHFMMSQGLLCYRGREL